ncbi:MAG TPA: carboxypeptidase-like regulatory domain-containing protein [Candidatus Bilamarchaeum sp.]|nr:carboxypeptidase-like regulatory domain-containing protein [Candidatus Bilamarchaeum sp.]
MFKHGAALLILSFLSYAIIVGPAIYEQDDFGDIAWSEFTYSISADCTAGTITTIVMNESNKPVPDATLYLQYIDFSTPLIGAVKSDKDGYALHKLPGQVQLMRGFFVLVIEKSGYRSKEVHFDLYPCFHNGSMPPKPPPPTPPPQKPPPTQNVTKPPANGSVNVSVPTTPPSNNSSGNETGKPDMPQACPLAAALPLVLVFLAVGPHRGENQD